MHTQMLACGLLAALVLVSGAAAADPQPDPPPGVRGPAVVISGYYDCIGYLVPAGKRLYRFHWLRCRFVRRPPRDW